MSPRAPRTSLRVLFLLAALIAPLSVVLPAQAGPWTGSRAQFATPRFQQVWRAADQDVAAGRTSRSWTWGPQPWFDYQEIYSQSPNGLRQVQYFDKARMELNDPASTGGPLGGVTNGLLTVELVSTRIKVGDGTGPDQNLPWTTTETPVAGDLNSIGEAPNPATPSYISFAKLATIDNGYRDPRTIGRRVGTTLTRIEPWGIGNVELDFRQDLADLPGTEIVSYQPETGHNIPAIFQRFMNAGPIPPLAAFGYPISDPYWITAQVGGQNRDVLVQLFERRTLTYTPSNPAAFQVEMGNVGQHYFQWRYFTLGKPWATPDPPRNIVFASRQSGPNWEVRSIDAGGNAGPLAPLPPGAVPASVFPTWDSYFVVYGEGGCANGNRQVLIGMPLKPIYLTPCEESSYEPAVSPDGSLIAYVSNRDGNPELYLQNSLFSLDLLRSGPERLTETAGCSVGRPAWLPDGSGLVYESDCGGRGWELYRARLHYTTEGNRGVRIALLISPETSQAERLTTNAADDRWPRVSPDGTQVAFFSNRDGNPEIYHMSLDGSGQTRLTNNPARDEGPAWSPDGRQIVFNSNRDGDHELYRANIDGSGLTQLTSNGSDDGYAVWAQ